MKLTPREVAQLEAALDEDQPTDTDRETELAHEAEQDRQQQLHDEMIDDALAQDGRWG